MKGFTLVEALIAAALALIVLLTALSIANRGTALSSSTAAQLALQADVRALVDDLCDDVHATLYLEEPATAAEFAAKGRVVLYRSAGADPKLRAQKNDGAFPFLSDSETTAQSFDVRKVLYERAGDEVYRTETGGFLTRTLQSDASFRYAFAADARVKVKRTGRERRAAKLAKLAIAPLALALDPQRGGRTLVPVGPGVRQDQACLLLFSLTARQPGVDGPDGAVEMTSKVWISEKLLAFRFPEFFSSVDENLGY